jgi:hypothetical protein
LLNQSDVFKLSVLLLVTLTLMGCGEKRAADFSKDEVKTVSCVIVMPTKVPYEESAKSTKAKDELRSGATFLGEVLRKELQKSNVSRIIDPSRIRSQNYDMSGGIYNAVHEIAKNEKCESALLSTISKFENRKGTEYAVDEPASAAFELKLIDTATGQILWMSSFSETQVSLMSNLLSFKTAMNRGFKWVTVEDLVDNGAQEKLRKCAYFY